MSKLNKQFFITGTDTGVGKTFVSCRLLEAVNERGISTLGLKPLASGCEYIGDQWQNDDALALQRCASVKLPYAKINPIPLPRAVAPHLAAKIQGIELSVTTLVNHYQTLQPLPSEFTLLEGTGGWLVPLNARETFADFVAAINIPVILVVGIRLGCINHALLTAHAIRNGNVSLAGWVGNCVDPETELREEIIDTLTMRLDAPCLGCVPHRIGNKMISDPSEFFDLEQILK